ncbi:MAG: hypothetical protein M3R36_13310 [Bacteroidota bacterium]|nr:hypothetical protein [Bacteroidota bacterium]
MEDTKNKISLKNELIRKSIHLSSSIVPVTYYFIDREIAVIILGIASFILILIDILRIRYKPLKRFYLKFMKPILRGHEINNDKTLFTGGTYITLAFFICIIIFPKPLAITAMFVVIFCDSFAAIIGKSKGKHFISAKTIEGSAAFFISGVIIILLTPKVTDMITEYYLGFIAIFLSTIFELIPIKIDDNISTPIFFGIVYLSLIKIFL